VIRGGKKLPYPRAQQFYKLGNGWHEERMAQERGRAGRWKESHYLEIVQLSTHRHLGPTHYPPQTLHKESHCASTAISTDSNLHMAGDCPSRSNASGHCWNATGNS
jgi:hypothetical protein